MSSQVNEFGNLIVRLILSHHGLKANGNATGSSYILPKAHVYIDCRGVPDGLSTADMVKWLVKPVHYFTEDLPTAADTFVRLIEDHVNAMPTRRSGQDNPYHDPIRIVFLCAWGQHRSKAVKEAIVEFLPGHWKVEVE